MLVHKRINALAKFVSKETGRDALKRVYVTEDEAVATNGHVMAIMPSDKDVADDQYPAGQEIHDAEELLLMPDHIDRAVKNLPKRPPLPALNYIQVGSNGKRALINSGLPVVQFPADNEDQGYYDYPDYNSVLSDYTESAPVRFAVNAEYLKRICDLAVKHGNSITKQITFEIPTTTQQLVDVDEDGKSTYETVPVERLTSAIKFDIRDRGETRFHGLIMPLRINED